ncbi:toll/interleukin-1 receptor domain-containing protein [Rhizobium laguerreae]|nr:toll/interleukin-1 receptor domain-containing protein [Rhizobium laguerreae]
MERLVEPKAVDGSKIVPPRRFFISYPRERSAAADQVEALLRRRNAEVFRDDDSFEVGAEITGEIRRNIVRSYVFLALYCREFMLSPWCFDELEFAFERSGNGLLRIALLCLDDSRVVPPQARTLAAYRNRCSAPT